MLHISKSRVKALFILAVSGLSASCGVIQSNYIEDMKDNERFSFLSSKSSAELCRYYNHALIKKNTEMQVEGILRARRIDRCDNFRGIRTVKQDPATEKIAKEILVSEGGANGMDKSLANASSSVKSAPEGSAANQMPNNNQMPTDALPGVVSKAEWVKILSDSPEKLTTDWLNKKAADLAIGAANSLKKGDRGAGLHQSVLASVVNEYLIDLSGSTSDSELDSFKKAQSENRKALLASGIHASVFAQSLNNLKDLLPQNKIEKSKMGNRDDVKIVKPSDIERKQLTDAVRGSLIDPDSARFYEFFVVGKEAACVMVNSKNRFGGYAGKTMVLLQKISGAWHYIYDAKTLPVCLNMAVKSLEKE